MYLVDRLHYELIYGLPNFQICIYREIKCWCHIKQHNYGLWSLGRHKVNGDAVNTMPLVRRHRVALPFEDMAQVATAGGASDLSPPAIRVGLEHHTTPMNHYNRMRRIVMEEMGYWPNGWWPPADLGRMPAIRSQSRIWLRICRVALRSLRSCTPLPRRTCRSGLCPAACQNSA